MAVITFQSSGISNALGINDKKSELNALKSTSYSVSYGATVLITGHDTSHQKLGKL